MDLKLSAMQGKQGEIVYYTAQVKISEAIYIFEFTDPNLPAELRAQRLIDPKRATAIASYVTSDREDYILPPIVAEVKGKTNFVPFSDDNANIGSLEIPTNARITIIDGQHRVKGLAEAVEKDETLRQEDISIIFYKFKSIKVSQTRFSKINSNSRNTTKTINQLYDHKDNVSKISRSVLKKIPKLDELVEKDKNSTSGKSDKIFPFRNLWSANKIISDSLDLQVKDITHIKKLYAINSFWIVVCELHPEWQAIFEGKQTPEKSRLDTIACHGVAIDALGQLGSAMLPEIAGDSDIPKRLRKRMANFPKISWDKTAKGIANTCIDRGKVIKNKQTVRGLYLYLYNSL